MAYWQWGDASADQVVVCAHGLSRQGRDFDVLARSLVERSGGQVRVVCPDVVGRGRSDWLEDPMGYQIPGYAADMLAMLARLEANPAGLGGHQHGRADRHGAVRPARPAAAGQGQAPGAQRRRPGASAGRRSCASAPIWARPADSTRLQQAADAMWAISTGFGPHTPEQWLALSRHMVRPTRRRGRRRHAALRPGHSRCRFATITQESAAQGEAVMWQLYDAITAQTLLIRGATSDVLSPETAQAMTAARPQGAPGRVCRRRPCADADRARPGRLRHRFPARRRMTAGG